MSTAFSDYRSTAPSWVTDSELKEVIKKCNDEHAVIVRAIEQLWEGELYRLSFLLSSLTTLFLCYNFFSI